MFRLSISLILLCAFISTNSFSQNVILGQSCALSGPAKSLGTGMKAGADAYFKNVSNIKLTTLDDKYEPALCTKNTNKLIADGVTALFGYVGTPTSKVAVPIAMSKKTIYFGPFTGAGFLHDAKANPYCFRVRASYDMETDMMVKRLTEDLGVKKIAIFVQDDGFGNVGKSGVEKAVKKYAASGVSIVGEGRYKRNTLAVKGGCDKVIASAPEAVILVGAYMPCGAAIKYWKKNGLNVPFVNISFVGSKALAKTVKADPKNVYITQVVPFPWDKSIPVVAEYHKAMGGQNIGFVTLEGYIAAKIIHKAIKDAGATVNSETLKTALEKIKSYDIGGANVSYSTTDHAGLNYVSMTKIKTDGSFELIKTLK